MCQYTTPGTLCKNRCVYTQIYVDTQICIYMRCVCVYRFTFVCIYENLYLIVYIYMYMCVKMHVQIYIHIYLHIYISMCMYICICM